MVLGFVWYLPQVMGNIWMKENNLKAEELNGSDPIPYVISFVSFTVMAFVLAWILKATSAETLMSALRVSLGVWAGFNLAPTLTNYLFSKRSWRAVLVDSGYALVTTLVFAVVLWAWR